MNCLSHTKISFVQLWDRVRPSLKPRPTGTVYDPPSSPHVLWNIFLAHTQNLNFVFKFLFRLGWATSREGYYEGAQWKDNKTCKQEKQDTQNPDISQSQCSRWKLEQKLGLAIKLACVWLLSGTHLPQKEHPRSMWHFITDPYIVWHYDFVADHTNNNKCLSSCFVQVSPNSPHSIQEHYSKHPMLRGT